MKIFINQSLELEKEDYKIKEILRLKVYLFNNWNSISIWNNKKYYTKCLTETYVQAIIKKIKGGIGKIYNIESIKRIIGYKSLFLNF